ncbi:MAG TPA: RNA polymerase sigma factor [Chloroflexota bacterium]|nr:RNA polymerase sigma factor [Chloroflexota bacterium]
MIAVPYVGIAGERVPTRATTVTPELVAPPSLADLVRRAQDGDVAAMGQVIASQQTYVYSIAMSLMRRPEDAADLTQEAFLRLCQVIGSYRGETKFTTWLYRLVTNLGLDMLRRRGRRPEATLDGEDEIDVTDVDPRIDPAATVDRHETTVRIRTALAGLPTAHRLALTLYYFQELKYEEIATVLGLPLNTVKAHIRRGKQTLARRLDVATAEEAS